MTKDKFEKIDEFLSNVINPLLPNAKFVSKTIYNESLNGFEAVLSNENLFKNSKYEVRDNTNLIHFTRIDALLNILESGILRMSNHQAMIEKGGDKQELEYASQIFNDKIFYNNKDYMNLRKDFYSLSCCISLKETKVNPYMWEKYTNTYKGGIIEFNTHPSYSELYYITVGKVLYSNENLDLIKKIKESTISFFKSNNAIPRDIIKLLISLISMHKDSEFLNENEVRFILFDSDNNILPGNEFITVKKDLNTKYNELFIYERYPFQNLEYMRIAPSININKIILPSNLQACIKKIKNIKNKYDYSFEIELFDTNKNTFTSI